MALSPGNVSVGPSVLTPSPVPRRLMKTPVAGHPLPQRGEGSGFNSRFAEGRKAPSLPTAY